MAEIKKVYLEKVPALRFIGKKYPDYANWGDWFGNGWFDVVEGAMNGTEGIRKLWEGGGGYVGLEYRKEGKLLEYWIGMFTPSGTGVPEGFESVDFAEGSFGTCWIYGKEGEVHGRIYACSNALADNGITVVPDENGGIWSFENGTCPRFTTPDENGNVILDYCYYIK